MNWSLYGLTNPLTSVADYTRNIHGSAVKSISSFYKSAFFGNNKVFIPRWSPGMLSPIQNILLLINGHIYTIILH